MSATIEATISDLQQRCLQLRGAMATAPQMTGHQVASIGAAVDDMAANLGWIVGRGFGAETIEQEIASAAQFAPDAKVVFDVGANIGGWSRAALARFPSARVVAFEPQDVNIGRLRAMEAEFGGRFSCRAVAISDKIGTAPIFSNEAGSILASLHKRDLRQFYGIDMRETQQVETTTLAAEMARFAEPIDILKIDVEGHELAVLHSAGDLLRSVRYIQFEFGGTMLDSKTYMRDFVSLLTNFGFQIFRLAPIGLVPIHGYKESYESFEISNYAAINPNVEAV